MPLLEVQTVNKVTATIALDESIARRIDQYAVFINAPSDEVVSKALEYVFTKDKDFVTFSQTAESDTPEYPLRIRRPMGAAERAKRGRRPTPSGTPALTASSTPSSTPVATQGVK